MQGETVSDYLARPESVGAVHLFRPRSHRVTYVYAWVKTAGARLPAPGRVVYTHDRDGRATS